MQLFILTNPKPEIVLEVKYFQIYTIHAQVFLKYLHKTGLSRIHTHQLSSSLDSTCAAPARNCSRKYLHIFLGKSQLLPSQGAQ